jgi:hypothetical protein
LEKHRLAVVVLEVIWPVLVVALTVVALVGLGIAAQQVEAHLLLLAIVPFTLEMAEAVNIFMAAGAEVARTVQVPLAFLIAEAMVV